VGKPLGIALFALLSNRLGLTNLPQGVTKTQLVGAGCAAGIGFTMSIFIANLSFTDVEALNIAKLAVVGASLAAGLLAFGWLRAVGEEV
jgi:NhaA family Na+:H+ antiporter